MKENKNMEKISQEDAEDAIRKILLWIGDNPNREGLLDTPARVIRSYKKMFSGYDDDPKTVLSKTFPINSTTSDMIVLSNIEIESRCEHHLEPIIGVAHIAYIPNEKIVGISKLARLVEIYSHRLQLQERLTQEIANAIFEHLTPSGVAVIIHAKHHCMCHRGIKHRNATMKTSSFLGEFQSNESLVQRFIAML